MRVNTFHEGGVRMVSRNPLPPKGDNLPSSGSEHLCDGAYLKWQYTVESVLVLVGPFNLYQS